MSSDSETEELSQTEKLSQTKILSWDVGIKNLAYCLLHKNGEEFKIVKWGSINLVENRQKCEFQLRTGSQCSELAKVCVYHKDKINLFGENSVKFSCTKHKEKMIPQAEKIEIIVPKTKSSAKKAPKQSSTKNDKHCCLCEEKADYSLEGTNYCWCSTHYEKKGESFIKKIKTKKVTVVSCNKQPIQELTEKLFSKLDKEFPEFVKVNRVIIENQPSLRNPTMKTIASILYSYFVMRGIIDKTKTNSDIEEVRFVSPSNKLKVNEGATNKILKKEDKTKVYKMTKKLGIKYCKALITDDDNKIIDKVKKKDDMCDAFLQGFQHLFNPVPKKHFKKIESIGFDEEKKVKKVKKVETKEKDTEKDTEKE
jgi:hypothetical protein